MLPADVATPFSSLLSAFLSGGLGVLQWEHMQGRLLISVEPVKQFPEGKIPHMRQRRALDGHTDNPRLDFTLLSGMQMCSGRNITVTKQHTAVSPS